MTSTTLCLRFRTINSSYSRLELHSHLPSKMRWHFKFFQTFFLLFYFHSHIIRAHLCNDTSFSSELLNQLSRVQKGQNVNGVHELKSYLSFYGYLNQNQHHEHDNIFDDSLEQALKKYQQFFKLNVTRTLDQKTLTKMCQPRCNMPDFANPNIKPLPLIHSRYSFFKGKPKWHTMDLTYSFDWNVPKQAHLPLTLALSEWSLVTPFKFRMVKNFTRANIKFSFLSGEHDDGFPFVEEDKELGHAFPPPDGRIHFNKEQIWSWTGNKNAYDIETAGLHELGHALGLEHSGLVKAVMYPVINPGVSKRLAQDDIDGIKALYK